MSFAPSTKIKLWSVLDVPNPHLRSGELCSDGLRHRTGGCIVLHFLGFCWKSLVGISICFRRPRCVRAQVVADDFPSKRSTNLPKRNRFDVPKYNDILRVKRDDKVIAVAPKRHQPFRTLAVGGQPNLKRTIKAVGSLVGDRDDWPTPARPGLRSSRRNRRLIRKCSSLRPANLAHPCERHPVLALLCEDSRTRLLAA